MFENSDDNDDDDDDDNDADYGDYEDDDDDDDDDQVDLINDASSWQNCIVLSSPLNARLEILNWRSSSSKFWLSWWQLWASSKSESHDDNKSKLSW